MTPVQRWIEALARAAKIADEFAGHFGDVEAERHAAALRELREALERGHAAVMCEPRPGVIELRPAGIGQRVIVLSLPGGEEGK
jgi:hypothetical protein